MKTKKPSKQRKRLCQGKLHTRKAVLNAHLSPELRKEMKGKRSLMIKKGDKVKIMRGKNKKKEGKIVNVDHKKAKVFIEKITRKKADGTEKLIPIKASNLLIIELEQKDEKRIKTGKATGKKEETKVDKKVPKKETKETKTKEAKDNKKEEIEDKKETVKEKKEIKEELNKEKTEEKKEGL